MFHHNERRNNAKRALKNRNHNKDDYEKVIDITGSGLLGSGAKSVQQHIKEMYGISLSKIDIKYVDGLENSDKIIGHTPTSEPITGNDLYEFMQHEYDPSDLSFDQYFHHDQTRWRKNVQRSKQFRNNDIDKYLV